MCSFLVNKERVCFDPVFLTLMCCVSLVSSKCMMHETPWRCFLKYFQSCIVYMTFTCYQSSSSLPLLTHLLTYYCQLSIRGMAWNQQQKMNCAAQLFVHVHLHVWLKKQGPKNIAAQCYLLLGVTFTFFDWITLYCEPPQERILGGVD